MEYCRAVNRRLACFLSRAEINRVGVRGRISATENGGMEVA